MKKIYVMLTNVNGSPKVLGEENLIMPMMADLEMKKSTIFA